MKRIFLSFGVCFVFLFFGIGHAQAAELTVAVQDDIRVEFRKVAANKIPPKNVIGDIEKKFTKDTTQYPAVVLAYYGALHGLLAKQTFSPARKMNLLFLCSKWLDEAVQKSPEDLEVRFVRFASLHRIPVFFGISAKRNHDIGAVCVQLLERNYARVNRRTQFEMTEYMLKSKRLKPQQKSALQKLSVELQKP